MSEGTSSDVAALMIITSVENISVETGIFFFFFKSSYHNNPKYWDRRAWANKADPDQMQHLIGIYSVCHSSIFWTHQQVQTFGQVW